MIVPHIIGLLAQNPNHLWMDHLFLLDEFGQELRVDFHIIAPLELLFVQKSLALRAWRHPLILGIKALLDSCEHHSVFFHNCTLEQEDEISYF